MKSLEAKAEREKKFEELREKFRKNLDNSLEILKNIRNEECDTDELETCLNLVKVKQKQFREKIVYCMFFEYFRS